MLFSIFFSMVLWTRSWKPFGALKKHLGRLREVFWRPSGSLLEPCVGSLGRLGSILDALSSKMSPRIPKESPKSRFLLKNNKNGNFGTRKREQNRSQNGTEKGSKKSHLKKLNFHIFLINLKKIFCFTEENGPRGPILLYFTMNSRVRKGRKIEANVAKTLGKQ